MQTDNLGKTPHPNLISQGMDSYGKSKGYASAHGWYIDFPTYIDYTSSLWFIGPSVLTFINIPYYATNNNEPDHSVTGVGAIKFVYNGSSTGHEYMEVHDNWFQTPTSIYIRYKDVPSSLPPYSGLLLDLFSLN